MFSHINCPSKMYGILDSGFGTFFYHGVLVKKLEKQAASQKPSSNL